MKVITARKISQVWAFPKDIAKIFGYKSPTKLLTAFRQFCDERPNFFYPYKPYQETEGVGKIYNVICFAYYFENRQLLDAGTRSLQFEDDLERLKEIYG